MIRKIAPLLLLSLSFGPPGFAADPVAVISGPSRVAIEPADPDDPSRSRTASTFFLMATGTVSDTPPEWFYLKDKSRKFPEFYDKQGRPMALGVSGLGPGVHPFALVARGVPGSAKPDTVPVSDVFVHTVTIIDSSPVPPVVVPPVDPIEPPRPPVDPVVPTPQVEPGKLRAMILYESADPMTRDQLDALTYTGRLAKHLAAKVERGPDGRPCYRIWDDDLDVRLASAEWQRMFAAAKADPKPLPKLVLYSGEKLVAAEAVAGAEASINFVKWVAGP